jgi:hypothetical protein
VSKRRYGVSPQPGHAPENSKSGKRSGAVRLSMRSAESGADSIGGGRDRSVIGAEADDVHAVTEFRAA